METWKRHEAGRTRQQRLTVRFTEQEKELIQNKAKELNMTLTELFLTVLKQV